MLAVACVAFSIRVRRVTTLRYDFDTPGSDALGFFPYTSLS